MNNNPSLLTQFCKFLEEKGYLDSDWRDEKPSPIDEFVKKNVPHDSDRLMIDFAEWVSIYYIRLPVHGGRYIEKNNGDDKIPNLSLSHLLEVFKTTINYAPTP